MSERAQDGQTIETSTQITQWEVSCLPNDSVNRGHFTITVEWRGPGSWAVKRWSSCLSSSGKWDHESIPSEREDEWLAEHRFDLDTALRLARENAPLIRVNGHTVADVLRAEAGDE